MQAFLMFIGAITVTFYLVRLIIIVNEKRKIAHQLTDLTIKMMQGSGIMDEHQNYSVVRHFILMEAFKAATPIYRYIRDNDSQTQTLLMQTVHSIGTKTIAHFTR